MKEAPSSVFFCMACKKRGGKPHYMVEAPGAGGYIQWLVKARGFWYNGYGKVSPVGLFSKSVQTVYEGGTTMKKSGRFLSALLAAVMVGQMGVVVGMADGETTDSSIPKCVNCSGATDHGMVGHTVTDVNGCEYGMHWLSNAGTLQSNDNTLQGGTGTNYFYPTTETTTINCSGTKNVFVFESIPQGGSVTVIVKSGFEGLIQIYIPNGSSYSDDFMVDIPSGEVIEERILTLKNGVTIYGMAFVNENGETPYTGKISIGPMPAESMPSIQKDENNNITITPSDTGDRYTYRWEIKQGEKQISFDIKEKAEIPNAPTEPGIYDYTCTVIENATGRTAPYSIPGKVVGCSVASQLVDEPKAINGSEEITLKSDTTITVEGTKVYNLEAVTYTNSPCADHTTDRNHGYKTTWEMTTSVEGVTVTPKGTMTIDGTKLSAETEKTVSLKVTVTRDKDTKSESVSFCVKGKKTAETPPPGPDKPGDSTEENKSEPPEITFTDDSNNTNKLQGNTVDIVIDNESAVPVSYKYTAGAETGNYTFKWTLDWKDHPGETPKYINFQQVDSSVTVIINSKPEAGTKDTLILTATPNVIDKAQKAAAVQTTQVDNATRDTSSNPSIVMNITNLDKAVGNSCTRTPSELQIINLPVTYSILTSDLAKPQEMPLSYQVLNWGDTCTDATHKDEDHIGQVTWTIVETLEPEWAKITQDGKITFYGDRLPKPENELTVKVVVTGNNKPVDTTAKITVKRDKQCNKVIQIKTDKTPIEGATTVDITSKDAVELYKLVDGSVTETGKCEFGDEVHESSKNHKIVWEYDNLPNGAKVERKEVKDADDKVNPNAINLLVNGSSFPKGTSTIKLKAYVASDPNTKYVVSIDVSKPSTSSGSGSSSKDPDYSDWYQWQDIEKDIDKARKGATVKVNLKDNTDMPFYIFDDLRGEDISLQMKVSGGYTWTVNGKTVKKLPGNQVWVALGVKSYSNSKMTALCRDTKIKSFELENNGSFYGDMRLTMNLGSSYAKKTAYLYSYDEAKNKLTYNSSAKADDSGNVDFVFTRSLGAYVVTSKALYGESAVSTGGGTVGSGNNPTTVYPPVVSVPASKPPTASGAPGNSSSSSSESSSSSSEPAPPPLEPSSDPDATPVDTVVEPEPEKTTIPILVPALILAIAGVITATVLVVRNNRGKDGFDIE